MTTPRYAIALTAALTLAAAATATDVRGIVAKIDPDKKELTLEARGIGLRGAVFVFTLPDQTPVMFGDQAGTLADLGEGRRVRVEFEVADGKQVVRTILVLGGPRPTAPVAVVPPPAGDGLSGVIRRIGYSDREMVVIGPGAKGAETETTVAVPDAAKIVKDGKEATLDDLKEGDAVSVQVEKGEGRPVAVSVQVGAAASLAPGQKPASNTIPRIRLLLKVADQVLQQIDSRNPGREP